MIGLWFIMFLMAGWQIPRLIQKNQLKELTVFLLLWLIAGIYGSLVLLATSLTHDGSRPSPLGGSQEAATQPVAFDGGRKK